MNDLIALLSTGNNPLIAAAAILAGWYFFLRDKTKSGGFNFSEFLSANKLTLLSVATTLYQNKDQLLSFAATFLSNVKSLFVKPPESK